MADSGCEMSDSGEEQKQCRMNQWGHGVHVIQPLTQQRWDTTEGGE